MPTEVPGSGTNVKTGKFLAHSDLLSYEELLRVVRLAVAMGMNKIRLTGGEPLLRDDILELVSGLSKLKDIEDISITTNGTLLEKYLY